MKSFFSSLKTGRTARKVYRTRDQADVFDYIERFYSLRRRHSTIGYLSPMEFERNKASVLSKRCSDPWMAIVRSCMLPHASGWSLYSQWPSVHLQGVTSQFA